MKEGERGYVSRHSAKAQPRPLDAQTLGIEVLRFLGSDPETAQRFFASAGLDALDLRSAVAEPGFLPAILDYLLCDDQLVERFAEHAGLRPVDVAATAQAMRERDDWSDDGAS